MIIDIYLVVLRQCLKSKMAAGGHFEKKFWSLFFNATIWFEQFQAKKFFIFFAFEKKIFGDFFKKKIGFFFFLRIVESVTLSFMCIAGWNELILPKNAFVLKNSIVSGLPNAFRPLCLVLLQSGKKSIICCRL